MPAPMMTKSASRVAGERSGSLMVRRSGGAREGADAASRRNDVMQHGATTVTVLVFAPRPFIGQATPRHAPRPKRAGKPIILAFVAGLRAGFCRIDTTSRVRRNWLVGGPPGARGRLGESRRYSLNMQAEHAG